MYLYPNRVLENRDWVATADVRIIDALAEDGVELFPTSDDAVLSLALPERGVDCELRVRSAHGRETMRLRFFLGDTLVAVHIVVAPIIWTVVRLTVGAWDSVEITANRLVDLDFLRAGMP